jgi:uncharacterized membrane protein YdjX (TVP38/TMEM64 family)
MKRRLSNNSRVALIALALIAAPVAARLLGVTEGLSAERLRTLVAAAGPWGPLAFFTVFVGAVVGQVPGFAFVIAAPALFRLPQAWALCFFASNVAVAINFAVVRRFGGQPLSELRRPSLQRLFAELDQHPIRTVAILRTLTVMFPPVTGALALTKLRARDHALGSALGMLLPVTAILLASAMLVEVLP